MATQLNAPSPHPTSHAWHQWVIRYHQQAENKRIFSCGHKVLV